MFSCVYAYIRIDFDKLDSMWSTTSVILRLYDGGSVEGDNNDDNGRMSQFDCLSSQGTV